MTLIILYLLITYLMGFGFAYGVYQEGTLLYSCIILWLLSPISIPIRLGVKIL